MKLAKQWPRRIIRADKQQAPQAAGVMLLNAGKVLLLKRSGSSDYAGKWCFPGGGVEEGETLEDAAIRECHEEAGIKPAGALSKVYRSDKHGADFTTFMSRHDADDEPTLNDEHDAAAWVGIDSLHKYDLHPGVAEAMGIQQPETETDVAIQIRDGKLPSPQVYANITLFDVRISGTGVSFREGANEFVMRKPEIYLTDEFLARCNGLPVIAEHPDQQALDSKEFSARIIGTIVLPYIKGNEVWGIAKIYDEAAASMMVDHQLSTSPSVVFKDGKGNERIELEDGSHLLIEGKPSLLDHLAIVDRGVWDKGGEPSGVKRSNDEIRSDSADAGNLNQRSETIMELNPEITAKKDAEGEAGGMGEVLSMLKGIATRMDGIESKIAQLESAEASEAGAAADGELPTPELKPAPAADNAEPSPQIAAMEKRVDALEAKTAPVPEGEAAAMADAQAKADSAYSAHGMRAPAPLMGEMLLSYRKRLASKMQEHSEQAKGVSLAAINDSATLGVMEGIIYADAVKAAAKVEVPAGRLVRKTKTGPGGIQINEYEGDPAVWMNRHLAPAYRSVKH